VQNQGGGWPVKAVRVQQVLEYPAAEEQITQISQGSWISESDQSRRAEITCIAWRAVGSSERGRLQGCPAAGVGWS
jgi:hypothetical protein